MTIRTKSAAIVIVTTLALVLIAQVLASAYIGSEVRSTESREVNEAVNRLENSIHNQVSGLDTITNSYAYWDDSYNYMHYQNQSYVDGNFNTQTILGLRVDFMLVLNTSFGLVVGKAVDLQNGTDSTLGNDTVDAIVTDSAILGTSAQEGVQESVSGLLTLPHGACMISSRAILRSDLSGPGDGYMIAGKYLDKNETDAISSLVALPLSISLYQNPLNQEFASASSQNIDETDSFADPVNDTTINGFGVLDDIHGQPVIILQTQLSRSAYQQGQVGMNMLAVLLIVSGAIIVVVSLTLQDRLIFSRMNRLGRDMKNIGAKGDPSFRLQSNGKDEVHAFAEDINAMLASLQMAGQELKESEEKFRNIFNNVGDAILIHHPDGPYLAVNDAAVARFGYSRDEFMKMRPQDIDAPEYVAQIPLNFERIQTDGSATFRTVSMTRDGQRTASEISARMVVWAGRPAFLVVMRDLADRIKAEENEVNLKRLEAMGKMAGGIAHDFNNLLTAISGNLSLAKGKLAPDDPLMKYLDEIEKATSQAANVSQGIMAFSKGGEPIRETADMIALVKGVTCREGVGLTMTYAFDSPPDLWYADVDPGQVRSAFEKVIENACSSMPGGGRIDVTFRNLRAEEEEIPKLEAGRYVVVSVRDHGLGIPAEVLSKIFDPYFTTRPGALGLGLTMAFATVTRHGGTIETESKEGEGTVMSIYLPASLLQELPIEKSNTVHTEGGNILLMDDEDYILEVNKEILQELGYSSSVTHNGKEALAAYKEAMENGRGFDAAIMDLTIPGGMGGKEAMAKLLEIDPKARGIVSSGYSNDPVMADYRAYGFKGVMPKPYKIADMARVLTKVLNEDSDES